MLVLGGSSGMVLEGVAAVLASHGYAAMALAYFGRPGLPAQLMRIPLEYFEQAVGWMRAQPWLGDGFLGALGASRGAELALLLASVLPTINAVVAYAPSGVVHGAVSDAQPDKEAPPPPAWTWRGQPVAHIQRQGPVVDSEAALEGPDGIVEAPLYFQWLRDEQAVARAEIRVERIMGPVLMISGRDDAM